MPSPARTRLSQIRANRPSKGPKNPKCPIRVPIHILYAANNSRGTSFSGLSTVETALEVNLDLTTKKELDSFTYSKLNLLVILSR